MLFSMKYKTHVGDARSLSNTHLVQCYSIDRHFISHFSYVVTQHTLKLVCTEVTTTYRPTHILPSVPIYVPLYA